MVIRKRDVSLQAKTEERIIDPDTGLTIVQKSIKLDIYPFKSFYSRLMKEEIETLNKIILKSH